MPDLVACPRCSITIAIMLENYCPLCGYKRFVSKALDAAYRMLAANRSLDFMDVVEIRDMINHQ